MPCSRSSGICSLDAEAMLSKSKTDSNRIRIELTQTA